VWRERGRVAREAISAAETSIVDLESRIAALRNDRGQTGVMDPSREQTRQAQIAQAQADLEKARADLDRARQALTDLEEDARRKGILPGWLREQ
jgi:outer membrane protein TolC